MNDLIDLFDSLNSMMSSSNLPDYPYTPLGLYYKNTLKESSVKYEEGKRLGGFYYYVEFQNGYGIDIAKHNGTYGREEDKWEIAVMKDGDCCYDTPITDDVIGWLTDAEALHYAIEVMKLPSAL